MTDLVGGGRFRLAPGRWYEDGYNSVTGECFDIGVTTCEALRSYRATGEPLSGSIDPRSAGNGSLMRLAPVAIRWWHDRAAAVAAARLQSRTTHGAAQAVEACALFAELVVEAIAGAAKEGALWGTAGAPAAWLDKLAWRERIEALAARLFEAGERERMSGH